MSSSFFSSAVEPEIHFVGQILGGDFPEDTNAFAAYHIAHGSEWSLVGGDSSGQTQVDYPVSPVDQLMIWSHPLDLHYYTKSLSGWPQIVFEVGKLDFFGNKQLIGYGFGYLPSFSGFHTIEIDVWRPLGTAREETLAFFLGGSPTLIHTDLIANLTKAREERCHLYTRTAGKIFVECEVLMRNLQQHDIQGQEENTKDKNENTDKTKKIHTF
jgi:B9 domain-containing protein 2